MSGDCMMHLFRNVTAIVLASGFSKRMGQNKLLMDIGNKPMIASVFDVLKKFVFREVLVVTSYEKIAAMSEAYGYRPVFNANPEIGQSHSVVLGVLESQHSDGWLFLNADMPNLKEETVQFILETALSKRQESDEKQSGYIIMPKYHKVPGQPVYFSREFCEELLAISGDTGGRQIMKKYPECIHYVEIEDSMQGMDIDTMEDYQRYCVKFYPKKETDMREKQS